MKGRPWYRRYPSNFLQGTSRLNVAQKGAYTVIIDLIFDLGRPIENDPVWLGRVMGCHTKTAMKLCGELCALGKIELTPDGKITNDKATEMLLENADYAAKFEASGRSGGLKAAENRRKAAQNNDLPEKTLVASTEDRRQSTEDSPSESQARPRAEKNLGSRLHVDWRPSEDGVKLAVDLGLDPEIELAQFRDYWIGVPGQKARKADWEATWRNRCRDVAGRRKIPRPTPTGELPLLTPIQGGLSADPGDPWGIGAWCSTLEGAKPITRPEDQHKGKWAYAGRAVDSVAARVAQAAGFNRTLRVDWSPLKAWLDEGLVPSEHIVPAVQRLAAYFTTKGNPASSLKAFDKAVHERKVA